MSAEADAPFKGVGFWRSADSPGLPDPHDWIDRHWDPAARRHMLRYLRSAPAINYWMGSSPCRICGKSNGCGDMTDGEYIWPEGLAHYVEVHQVRLPPEFERHVAERGEIDPIAAQRGIDRYREMTAHLVSPIPEKGARD